MKTTLQLNNWKLKGDFGACAASVPGDISYDLYKAGVITDPYFGINHLEHGWIIKSDFVYETEFAADGALLEQDEVILTFEGIDTFSEIYLNGKKLGDTDNMFLAYTYSVKELLKKEGNLLQVKMISTISEMEKFNTEGYFGTFNVPRLFIRKAQCHFGWDWAPDMPGYGIYKPVKLEGVSSRRFSDVSYKAYNEGEVTLYADLNYTIRPRVDSYGVVVAEADEECKQDVIRYTLATLSNASLENAAPIVKEYGVGGAKNFVNFKIENPEIWWPIGYGEHPLYSYKVELINGDRVLDVKEGRLAFREVKLSQRPKDDISLEYQIYINGVNTFIKGTNWVPAECFTGTIKDEKYEKLVRLAKNGNVNMLRVWGGGIYESDLFYDLCDELGIMVWQDMMFACSDIPEDLPEFVENCKKELYYQIKRLRNHPSIVYWCGGNEKTGCYGLQISHGDYFIDVIVRGIINHLDDTRPFARQSPCSITDVGNDITSGECHAGSCEPCLTLGIENYRDIMSGSVPPFVSECALMGPGSLESMRKFMPEDKLWPMNEYWNDRLMDNPYAAVPMPFADRQRLYSDRLYGESHSIEEFIAKAMTVHAEALRAELEYARFNKAKTGGIMNWMYSDIWPSGTWSIVDYYCEPKQAYYQMKRSFEPTVLTFVQGSDKKLYLTLLNDTLSALEGEIEYGVQSLDGKILSSGKISASVCANGVWKAEIDCNVNEENTFLYAKGVVGGKEMSTVYSHSMWRGCKFESDYSYDVSLKGDELQVSFKANKFAKGITLRLPGNHNYIYSDNYFDLNAGEEKVVTVYGACGADIDSLVVTDFAKESK